MCSLSMSTTSCYGVVDVIHVAMFSNFECIYVSDNVRLRYSASLGCFNLHDVDVMVVLTLDIKLSLLRQCLLREVGNFQKRWSSKVLEGTVSTSHFYCQ